MRVLHVLDYAAPYPGSVVEALASLGAALARKGSRLEVAFPEARGWFDDLSGRAVVHAMPQIRQPLRSGFRGAVLRLAADRKIDLLHLHFSFALALALGASLRGCPIPVVYHWRNPPKALLCSDGFRSGRVPKPVSKSLHRGRGSLARLLARFGDRRVIGTHVAISREIRDLLLRHGWAPPEKVEVIRNPLIRIPALMAPRPRLPGEPIRLGCVANLRPQKDHPTLLRGFRRLLDVRPACRLLLVGDGSERARLEWLAKELGVEDRVRFLGFVGNPEGCYAEMDLFVLCTHFEGQGMVLLEAMSRGLPVVATRLPSIAETIADGEEGFLVPPGDAPALARALRTLVDRPELRGRMGMAGREKVCRRFGADRWARRLIALYERTLEGESPLVPVPAREAEITPGARRPVRPPILLGSGPGYARGGGDCACPGASVAALGVRRRAAEESGAARPVREC